VTPQQLLGRVSAINVLAQGARPVGAGLGAIISATYGIETSLIVAVLGFALQLAIIVASPAVRLERQPTLAAA
jgi:hypothetical protein